MHKCCPLEHIDVPKSKQMYVVAYFFFPQDIEILAIALCMVGKFAIAIAFGLIYLYSCELYPTIVR